MSKKSSNYFFTFSIRALEIRVAWGSFSPKCKCCGSQSAMLRFSYCKLVVVCSRASLCNNCHIFWLASSTKLLLGFSWDLIFDRCESVYIRDRDRLRQIRDYYNTVSPTKSCLTIGNFSVPGDKTDRPSC